MEWPAGPQKLQFDAAAYCIIDLNDLWANFCRELTMDMACGKALLSSGVRSIPYAGAVHISGALAAVSNKRGFEPRWHAATETVKALQSFPSAETSTVVAAISSKASPAPDLNAARNYFAHRRSECREKLSNAGFYDQQMLYCPFRIGNFLRNDGTVLIDHWIDELSLIAAACA